MRVVILEVFLFLTLMLFGLCFGGLLDLLKNLLGLFGGAFGASWGLLGPSWGGLAGSFGRFGGILGAETPDAILHW